MVSTNDASGQADLLNSIVTITDLVAGNGSRNEVDTLGQLIEAIARLKGTLVESTSADDSFGESGGFESLLKAIETACVVDDTDTAEESADDPATAPPDTDIPQDERFQLQRDLLQLTFGALSQAVAASSSAKSVFAGITGYTQIEHI